MAELPNRAGDKKNIICVSYEAYSDAEDKFSKYVLAESEDHEVVSVKFSTVEPTDLKNLDYLLPLRFMGESIKSLGKYDADFEMIMFKIGWGDDVEVTYNPDTGYVVAHTDDFGSAIQVRAMYDGGAEPDSIFGLVPDEDYLINGATHWLTITDGKFTGNIGGEAF